jgi:Nif-specific regulatory protein
MSADSDLPISRHGQSDHDAVYLILRDDIKWRNVFRLTPGQVTTIGRAPTNRVVIPDDICSRNHCEVFQVGGRWVVRDLDSRNGTLIDGNRLTKDVPLTEGDELQIGDFYLVFTNDISRSNANQPLDLEDNTDTYEGGSVAKASAVEPEILHRRRKTRFHTGGNADGIGRDRTSQELAKLYRLALDMGAAKDNKRLAEIVLDGLFNGPNADIGAVLLLPKDAEKPNPSQLRLVAYRSRENEQYEKVSHSLTSIVLDEWQGILARDFKDDSRLTRTDSLQQLQARSVICVPIRTNDSIYGVIHLYTTHGNNTLDVDDLEYTLAIADQFALSIEALQEREHLEEGLARVRNENESLRSQLHIETDLVGDSASMSQLKDSIARIAPTDATALIRGESGVGKELVARAIHFGSDRRNGPYVTMNCAALSESLLESELFGHEKGSFTGAVGRKLGKFEQANRGTLFLDEVGEMSLAIQAKFLRVLEGHPFERVGGSSPIQVDVRVVAATNRDLEKAIEEKTFRRDLFFRLFVVEIAVPALRQHASDIPMLASFFLKRFTTKISRRIQDFSEDALRKLCNYDWPGNVRELENTIERAVILSRGELIEAADIQLSALTVPTSFASPTTPDPMPEIISVNRDVSLDKLEREHILAILERTNWNKSLAAHILGIERSTLDRKLKRYQVGRPQKLPE